MQTRAALLALGSFVVFAAIIIAVWAALDVRWVLVTGPLLVIGLSSVQVYRSAVRDGPG